jgi:hypothetical protein
MDIELLAKMMRDRALLIEGNNELDEESLRNFKQVEIERKKKLIRLEKLKKLYFDAGRWVGGARDYTARQAYEQMKALEK